MVPASRARITDLPAAPIKGVAAGVGDESGGHPLSVADLTSQRHPSPASAVHSPRFSNHAGETVPCSDLAGPECAMTTPTQSFLRSIGACPDAREWVGDRDLPTAWADCERGDWMLWLVGRTIAADRKSPERRRLVWVACQCARLVLPIYESRYPYDLRSRTAIETAERWTRGEATLDEVWISANVAAAAAYAAAAAAYAAYAAAYAAAAYAADAAAADAVLRQCADLCRAEWPVCPVTP